MPWDWEKKYPKPIVDNGPTKRVSLPRPWSSLPEGGGYRCATAAHHRRTLSALVSCRVGRRQRVPLLPLPPPARRKRSWAPLYTRVSRTRALSSPAPQRPRLPHPSCAPLTALPRRWACVRWGSLMVAVRARFVSSQSVMINARLEAIESHRRHPTDCGSSEVQIAAFTERIKFITTHVIENPKDHASRRGLLKVGRSIGRLDGRNILVWIVRGSRMARFGRAIGVGSSPATRGRRRASSRLVPVLPCADR